jgi:general L-amino acid transport system substrate-binding protein
MRTKILMSAGLLVVGLATGGAANAGPTLDAVKARGELICAVNGARPGLSAVDSKGQWSGLDVDTCRAVAAAVLGDESKVRYVKTTTQTRMTVLQTGDVDHEPGYHHRPGLHADYFL